MCFILSSISTRASSYSSSSPHPPVMRHGHSLIHDRYLHQNSLRSLADFPALPSLRVLSLCCNHLTSLSGLEGSNARLETLTLSGNHLAGDLDALTTFPGLTTLDLSSNRLDDMDHLLCILRQLPLLRALYLSGNPCVTKAAAYRKRVVGNLPHLAYLDKRPIMPLERATAEAWVEGGEAAASQARGAHLEQTRLARAARQRSLRQQHAQVQPLSLDSDAMISRDAMEACHATGVNRSSSSSSDVEYDETQASTEPEADSPVPHTMMAHPCCHEQEMSPGLTSAITASQGMETAILM
uniref:Uncharacterized protein n=1 Tax=Auxenochlorella protothecoides TaxID=3075 RepID=A0A1D1ZRU2_AUXPR